MKRGRPRHPELLTPREQEVMTLLRDGLTNSQIAERLGISLAGARYHVSEILSKLGVNSREDAAAWLPSRPDSRLRLLAVLRALLVAIRFAVLAACVVGLAAALLLTIGRSGRVSPRNDIASPEASNEVADRDLAAFLAQTSDALVRAQTIAPDLLLLQVNVDTLSHSFSFRFTDIARTQDIYVSGPNTAPGHPVWEVRSMEPPNGFIATDALDILRLQNLPQRVNAVFKNQVAPAMVPFGLTLYSQASELRWAAFGSLPDGILRCDIRDQDLTATCPVPPLRPPPVATATP